MIGVSMDMDWLLYWTILLQLLIFIVIMTFPLALSLMLIFAAARRDTPKRKNNL